MLILEKFTPLSEESLQFQLNNSESFIDIIFLRIPQPILKNFFKTCSFITPPRLARSCWVHKYRAYWRECYIEAEDDLILSQINSLHYFLKIAFNCHPFLGEKRKLTSLVEHALESDLFWQDPAPFFFLGFYKNNSLVFYNLSFIIKYYLTCFKNVYSV